jgi:dihydrodipicolinate synthase/N-acetylneuraminate lyase
VDKPIVVVALLTPFGEDGRLDVAIFQEHVAFLVSQGVDAVMPAGTTGEGPLLDDNEVVKLVAAAVTASGGRITVLAHVGRAATDATVRLAGRALGAGADGVSAVVPYFYALEDGQVLDHYRAVTGAVGDLPTYAYTIPARTGNELSPAVVAKLADEGVAGLKDSTKSLERHRKYLDATRGRPFRILMGSDGLVLDALRAGAAGCVSAAANARPDLLVRLNHAFVAGDEPRAERLQAELSAVREELSRGPALTGIKRAAAAVLRDRGVAYPERLRGPLG